MDGVNEGFYHGMMLGLCAVLGNRYRVRSNRESGLGRFDIQLMPMVNGIPGFLLNLNIPRIPHADLTSLADKALQQIDEKKSMTQICGMQMSIPLSKSELHSEGKNVVVKRA